MNGCLLKQMCCCVGIQLDDGFDSFRNKLLQMHISNFCWCSSESLLIVVQQLAFPLLKYSCSLSIILLRLTSVACLLFCPLELC